MKLFDSLRTRSFRAGGYSVVAALIVLALLVALNLIVDKLPSLVTKLDATPAKVASISDQTKNVLKTLDKDVTLYWFCQEGYEDPTVEALLGRYESASAYIKVEKRDPDVNPGLVEQYVTEYYNNAVLVECGDRTRYVDYIDIYVQDMETYYSTGEEVWNFEGEDALTRAIYYVVTDNLPKAYYLSGHSEMEITDTLANSFSDDNVEIAELNLISEAAIPEDADLVMCIVPQIDISEIEKTILTDYMAAGGKFLLVTAPLGESMPNLESVMEVYGVSTAEGVVMEGNSKYYSSLPYYLLPQLASHEITDPVISNNYYVLLPSAQGLKVSQTDSTTVTVTELLTTTDESYSKVNTSSNTMEMESGDIAGPFSVGVAIEDAATGAQAVWYSSSYIFYEEGGNRDLFFNAVNWMCDQKEMISIRSKDVSVEYLNMNEEAVKTMTWIIVAIIPLSYLAIGINTYVRRKRR